MSCHPRVTAWTTVIQAHLPHVPKPHATVLALGSLGRGLARSWALPAVRAFLAPWLGRTAHTVRQPLREFCYDAAATRGTARWALRVATCCVPLLAWGVSGWQGTPLVLALEATTWGRRLTVLGLSVVSRGGAIPVVWVVLPAPATPAWRREWVRMLRPGPRAAPRAWTVIGLADRRWSARWLLRRIPRRGWPPLLRLTTGGTFRPQGHVHRLHRPSPPVPLSPAGPLGGGV
jgi:hypothetical protein